MGLFDDLKAAAVDVKNKIDGFVEENDLNNKVDGALNTVQDTLSDALGSKPAKTEKAPEENK